ncbi:NAD(+)--dinitrogen-reductase ADP-D-ribosyltransferase [Haloferula sargassicola]|uniref:NAD(+)--dinitrogen-reductase ADP-D-ribosyltransferase n=1 Tax=Haloferula sargassicola TaxID=490096 RepID=A0ABP9UPT2_9BACT
MGNRPPWTVASVGFQDDPSPLHIGRVKQEHRRLFEILENEVSPARRGEIFHEYASVQFALHQWQEHRAAARRSLRNSYVRFIRGWAVDSNTIEGAVLKGWVHSRLGIAPTFHQGSLGQSRENFERYARDRIRGCARTNAIEQQLDLLFEFCQYEIHRRNPGERWLTLYRGTFDGQAYRLVDDSDPKRPVVRMNNISSFTADRECAWEFGSTVWEVRVPLSKVFFFSTLLPESILKGEEEHLVIGGEYRVRKLLY